MSAQITPLAIFLFASFGSAQVPAGPIQQVRTAQEHVIHVWSGDGLQGASDAGVTALVGPSGGWGAPITPAQFTAARNGPQAIVLDTLPWGIKALSTNPLTQWIGPNLGWGTGLSQTSALLAAEFTVPGGVFQGTMDFHYTADDNLGQGAIAGLYLNGGALPNTTATGAWWGQFDFSGINVSQHLRPGKNVLYVYVINTGGAGGVLFDAIVRVNASVPDECGDAHEVFLEDNQGNTTGMTTSLTPSSCASQNDAWHYFVPHTSGTLTVKLDAISSGMTPALTVYNGACGALNEIGCTTAPAPGGVATWSGTVHAGEPVFLRVGGATANTGKYRVNLGLNSSSQAAINPANGHLYKTSPNNMTMPQARLWAASLGGYLVAINDAAEHAWVANEVPSGSIWLGASDELTEGTWLWDNGDPFVYTGWGGGEPNDSAGCNGEDFVEMDSAGTWRDYPSGPSPCGNVTRRGMAEIPTANLASISDLGGACGPNPITPGLFSEPHVVGTTVSIGVFDADPGDVVFVLKSPPPSTPAPLGSCTIFLDQTQSTLVSGFVANGFGSGAITVAIPSDPMLLGIVEIWQAQIIPLIPAASYTNAIEVTIGN